MSESYGHLISPLSAGGERRQTSLRWADFLHLSGKKDRSKNYPFTLIGFDTEYQTDRLELDAPTIEEQKKLEEEHNEKLLKGELRYEVLSYQFYVAIVYPPIDEYSNFELEGKICEWSGIFLPESGDREDRKTFQELIEFALGSGREHWDQPDHKIQIPKDIYLLAHYTRADVSAFDDFTQKDSRKKLNLTNVRNTFTTLGDRLSFNLNYEEMEEREEQKKLLEERWNKSGKYKVKYQDKLKVSCQIRDTILLAPQQIRKLDEVGEVVGIGKVVLGGDKEKHKHIITNMKTYRDINWEEFREYGIRDAEICIRYAYEVMMINHQQTGKFSIPVTLTSMGLTLLKKKWAEDGYNRVDLIGKEVERDGKFNRRSNRMPIQNKEVFKDRVYWRLDFVTEGYHGGRNEQYTFGVSEEDEWVDYDLTSAYPSAMNIIGVPDWDQIKHIETTKDLFKYGAEDLAFASVDFKFPPHIKYPVLPVRTLNGIVFPLSGRSLCGIPELILARQLGAEIDVREGVVVPTDRTKYRIFNNFIKECVDKRNQYKKGTLQNLFWKEVSNSTYGKTAQGLRERRVFDLKEESSITLAESDITNPFFASFITSFVRAVLGEIMNNLPSNKSIISVTTDGFLTNASKVEIEAAAKGELSEIFLQSRKRIVGKDDAEILEIKHKAKQVMGWRTRGQATIKAHNDSFEDDGNFVLQKGGITIRDAFSREAENQDILNKFFNRTPNKSFAITTGVQVKEQFVYGNDFVDKILTRSLSMEYDFKRRPINLKDTEIEVNGVRHTHLQFDTEPWKNVEDFIRVRNELNAYNKNSKHCFKTFEDYERFRIYIESRNSLMPEHTKWMHKEDGDLQRLRQELCSAFRRREAGFELIDYDKGDGQGKRLLRKDGKDITGTRNKLKHDEWIRLLNYHIGPFDKELTVKDMENTRKRTFIPHNVPRTDRVVEKLNKLKEIAVPNLDIDLIVSTDKGISI